MPKERVVINSLMSGDFRITSHAYDRMLERGIQKSDIMEAARTCVDCYEQKPDQFELTGYDRTGDELSIIAAYDGDVLVITVFGGRE